MVQTVASIYPFTTSWSDCPGVMYDPRVIIARPYHRKLLLSEQKFSETLDWLNIKPFSFGNLNVFLLLFYVHYTVELLTHFFSLCYKTPKIEQNHFQVILFKGRFATQAKSDGVFIKKGQIQHKVTDIHIECSKQFKWNSYFYVSGQSRPFWAALRLL